jgi:hypothetical protein
VLENRRWDARLESLRKNGGLLHCYSRRAIVVEAGEREFFQQAQTLDHEIPPFEGDRQ